MATKRTPLNENTVTPTARASYQAVTQAGNPASQLASNGASQEDSTPLDPLDRMVTKSYRVTRRHAKRFALWAKERDMTEQEATRLAQLRFMEGTNGH